MSGSEVTPIRRRKAGVALPQGPKRHTVLALEDGRRGKVLAELLTKAGYVSYRERAAYLGVSTTALHRAFKGERAEALVAAVKARWPRRLNQIFDAEVTDDAAPQTKAA